MQQFRSIDDLSGQVLGSYRLQELLGKGAMSAVYHGYHMGTHQHAAVKVLAPAEAPDVLNVSQRFLLEAQTVAGLSHANIVPYYDYGSANAYNYLVMRLLTGGTLEDRLIWCFQRGRLLPSAGEIVNIVQQVGSALDYAHARGVLHRDVKASNILFDEKGVAYLVDFGIVKLLDGSLDLTHQNIIIGTPNYMPPEQWRGEPLTAAADQYALAVTTYLMLTGELPFDADTSHALMYQHLNERMRPASDRREGVPRTVDVVLERALDKDPARRYVSCQAFIAALHTAVRASPGQPTGFSTFMMRTSAAPTAPRASSPLSMWEPPVDPHVSTLVPVVLSYAMPRPMAVHLTTNQYQTPAPSRWKPLMVLLVGGTLGVAIVAVTILSLVLGLLVLPDNLNSAADSVGPANAAETEALRQPESTTMQLPPTDQNLFSAVSTVTRVQTTQIVTATPAETVAPTEIKPTVTAAVSPAAEVAMLSFPGSAVISAANAVSVEPMNTIPAQTTIRSLALSPISNQVAFGDAGRNIQIWDLNTRTRVMGLSGNYDVIYSVEFSPDGTRLASGGGDGTVRVWDVASGEALLAIPAHPGGVRRVEFSPDGTRLASVGEDNSVRLWNTQDGAQIALMQRSGGRSLSVAFSPDATMLATGSSDMTIVLWDIADETAVRTWRGHTGEVRSVAFSPDGTRVVSAGSDATVRVWDVATGENTLVITEPRRELETAVFNTDGTLIASAGREGMVNFWNASTGEKLAELQGHEGWVFDVDFNADSSLLASGGGDGIIRLWHVAEDALQP